jgi:hypothetical protein
VDFVVSVFKLVNRRGYSLPMFNFGWHEQDSGTEWRANCGGTRVYLVRYATPLNRDMDEQAAESHFMMRRITGALLMSGFGLFQAESTGRVIFTDVYGEMVNWTAYIDQPDPEVGAMEAESSEALFGWIRAISLHTPLRRATEDAHAALANPHEALFHSYCGLEWLVKGMGYSWEDIATELDGSKNDISELKKMANHETGVRHASRSGTKLRAEVHSYSAWVSNLFDMINAARAKAEPGYVTVAGKKGAYILSRAMPHFPFE